jgi:hypothetical protein
MRHGYEWWEAFWKRLLMKAAGIDVWSRNEEKLYALPVWLISVKNEFEREWMVIPLEELIKEVKPEE